jgi:hypothetical protein
MNLQTSKRHSFIRSVFARLVTVMFSHNCHVSMNRNRLTQRNTTTLQFLAKETTLPLSCLRTHTSHVPNARAHCYCIISATLERKQKRLWTEIASSFLWTSGGCLLQQFPFLDASLYLRPCRHQNSLCAQKDTILIWTYRLLDCDRPLR